MFVLSQSATGQYVITHPPTNTVMVGDDLVATFERMRAFAEALEGPTQTAAPIAPPPRARTPRSLIFVVVLALLPFVWLGALHVSLGRLVSELRAPANDVEDRKELRARIERLESSLAAPDVKPVKPKGPKKAAVTAPVEAETKAEPTEPDDADDADEG